jgi:hypothetical protein
VASHEYYGTRIGRASRFHSKLGGNILTHDRLTELIGTTEPSACSCEHGAHRHDRTGCNEMLEHRRRNAQRAATFTKCPCLWNGRS